MSLGITNAFAENALMACYCIVVHDSSSIKPEHALNREGEAVTVPQHAGSCMLQCCFPGKSRKFSKYDESDCLSSVYRMVEDLHKLLTVASSQPKPFLLVSSDFYAQLYE